MPRSSRSRSPPSRRPPRSASRDRERRPRDRDGGDRGRGDRERDRDRGGERRERSREEGGSSSRHRHRSRSPPPRRRRDEEDGGGGRERERDRGRDRRPRDDEGGGEGGGRGGGGGSRRERPVPFGEKPREQEARYEWGMPEGGGKPGLGSEEEEKKPLVVDKANFGLTGALAKDAQTGNVYKGVVLKWTEPDDARKPERGWRLYVFKDGELKDTLHLHRQSAYLVGRHDIADLKVEHPSCSKQHAVIQFRLREVGGGVGGEPVLRSVKPYLMDLESVNKTRLNGEEVPPARYVELRPQDTIQFGLSSREYVLMHENLVEGK